MSDRADRLAGALLGVALGDALGLPYEGLCAARIGRRSSTIDRFALCGRTGFVSDDTEQTALIAQALALAGGDCASLVRLLRRSLVGWLARLPFGIGGATLRACVRMMLGFPHPGVRSAGNGAAMRAGIVGAFFASDADRRREIGRALATLTHTDRRAVQAALYVAEIAAGATLAAGDQASIAARASEVLVSHELVDAHDRAMSLARERVSPADAARALGNSGFVVHTVGICTYCFVLHGAHPMRAIEAAICAGGDTDTHAAIVGGWVGALHGATRLPADRIASIHDGPFGPSHLRALAQALADGGAPPRWSWPRALLRNLALYPVVLAHGVARLAPW